MPCKRRLTHVFHYLYSDFDTLTFKLSATYLGKKINELLLKIVDEQDVRILLGVDDNRTRSINIMNHLNQGDILAIEFRKWLTTTNLDQAWQ